MRNLLNLCTVNCHLEPCDQSCFRSNQTAILYSIVTIVRGFPRNNGFPGYPWLPLSPGTPLLYFFLWHRWLFCHHDNAISPILIIYFPPPSPTPHLRFPLPMPSWSALLFQHLSQFCCSRICLLFQDLCQLDYHQPRILAQEVHAVLHGSLDSRILDVGAGTGLGGQEVSLGPRSPYSSVSAGVGIMSIWVWIFLCLQPRIWIFMVLVWGVNSAVTS